MCKKWPVFINKRRGDNRSWEAGIVITVGMHRCAKRVPKWVPFLITLTMTCWAATDLYFFPFHPVRVLVHSIPAGTATSPGSFNQKCQPIPTNPPNRETQSPAADATHTARLIALHYTSALLFPLYGFGWIPDSSAFSYWAPGFP